MKFLCVPCDSPMKLQTIDPPEGGSLSVVYACPECGYEMAMLTNPFETQLVQSLGVRIGPSTSLGASPSTSLGTGPSTGLGASPSTGLGASPSTGLGTSPSAGLGTSPSTGLGTSQEASAGRCPFPAMMAAREGAPLQAGEPGPVRWTSAAEARLANIPAFVRPMARTGIETFARERGVLEVDEKILDAAREFFGM